MSSADGKILFFDGYCGLCNGLVDRLMKMDRGSILKFAPIQGETARALLPPEYRNSSEPETVVYLRDGIIFERSTAILNCLRDLGGPLAVASVFSAVPKPLRDVAYRMVATTRYSLFGKRNTCRMPSDLDRQRLLP